MPSLTRVATAGSSATADDAGLCACIAGGDPGALELLYQRHAPRAMAIALRVLGSPTEAEEIVQETFLEVWRRAAQYDSARGTATAWIAAMARSRAIDRARTRGSAARAVAAAADEELPPGAPSPLEDIERRRERERVSAALRTLPAEQRQPIQLAYFHGLSQREIAERTGQPLGTVKTRVRIAMEKLATLLGGEP